MSKEIEHFLPILPLLIAAVAILAWLRWAITQRLRDEAKFQKLFHVFTEAVWVQLQVFGADGTGEKLKGCTKLDLRTFLEKGFGAASIAVKDCE